MPVIDINGIVRFSPSYGVIVEREAVDSSPEEVFEAIRVAWSYMDDEYLVNACCGGIGLLAEYNNITFEEFLKIREQSQVQAETEKAKKVHTKTRRKEFNVSRSH